MTGIEENGTISRGPAPVSGISVPGRVAEGCDLVHALDYVVFLQVMCNLAAGAKFTPQTVWKQLQARGIRSAKNASVLVGRDAVYESFARLIEAGYMRRVELPNEKHPGRKGPIAYQAFDNPAWNPDWQAQQAGSDPLQSTGEEPQVGTLPGTPDPVKAEVEETAGQNASRNAGSGNAGSGVSGSGSRRVPAGQNASGVPGSVQPSPPLPPGGGTTPPPTPSADGTRQHPSQTEEEGVFDEKELAAAVEFLERLPDPWTHGRKDAAKTAPLLLMHIRNTGWPSILEADLRMLETATTGNPGGLNNPIAVYRSNRLPNLKRPQGSGRKSAVGQRNAPAEGMCARHQGYREDDCPPCRKAEMERSKRQASGPARIDGAGLLANLLQKTDDA